MNNNKTIDAVITVTSLILMLVLVVLLLMTKYQLDKTQAELELFRADTTEAVRQIHQLEDFLLEQQENTVNLCNLANEVEGETLMKDYCSSWYK